MSKLISIWVLFLSAVLNIGGCGSTKQIATEEKTTLSNTVLWEIQSPDLDVPSYLFGTIHLIPEEMYFWPEEFQNAYNSTDQVVLETNELDMDPAAMMGIMPKIMLPDGQSLQDLVSEEDYKQISDYFDEMGLPLRFFKNIKPFFLYMLIDVDMASLFQDGFKSYELEITEKAKKDQKPVYGLESMDFQISLFDSIPYQDQANLLVQAINQKSGEDEAQSNDESNNLYKTYVDQDLNKILNEVQQTDVALKKFTRLLVDDRNKAWIPKIKKYIEEKPTFIAVGAAHLPGEMGVIHLLEQAGYTLEPIMNLSDGID